MKKILVFLLAGIMILGVAGCGQKDATTENDSQATIENNDNKGQEENNVFSSIGFGVEAVKSAPETDASMFQYEEIDGGISITDYTGEDAIVVIPEKIDGQDVIAVGEYAFSNNEDIKGVKIADSVTVIERDAFCNCSKLEIVICGKNLSTIEIYAFNNCVALWHMELNEGIEILKESCFAMTDSLKEIFIPSSVVTMEYPFIETQTNVTIHTEAGSVAEQYATEMNIPCETK